MLITLESTHGSLGEAVHAVRTRHSASIRGGALHEMRASTLEETIKSLMAK